MCFLDVFVGPHSNMDKEFWKFIEFEGSGRPHRGDGMIEAFRLLVCPPGPDAILQYTA